MEVLGYEYDRLEVEEDLEFYNGHTDKKKKRIL
jgi:hypothetical protein